MVIPRIQQKVTPVEKLLAYIERVINAWLPAPWQRISALVGFVILIVICPVVPGGLKARIVGGSLGVFLVLMPVITRLWIHASYFDQPRSSDEIIKVLTPHSRGTVLYASEALTAQDSVIYLAVEETGPPLAHDLTFQIVLLRRRGARYIRDRVITEIGSENRRLLGNPPEWSHLCGFVRSERKTFLYVVAGSFGYRHVNRSAVLTFYDVDSNEKCVASYSRRDDYSTISPELTYDPPQFPNELVKAATHIFEEDGFNLNVVVEKSEIDGRFWLQTYQDALDRDGRVTITERWFKLDPQFLQTEGSVNVDFTLRDERYILTSFRNSPIIRVRPDGMASVVFVTTGFTSILVDEPTNTVVFDDDGLTKYRFHPSSGELEKLQ